jgi:hypothetical protein
MHWQHWLLIGIGIIALIRLAGEIMWRFGGEGKSDTDRSSH